MRLTPKEQEIISVAVHTFDPRASLWLFGSRTDDAKKGGDIDIAILSATIGLEERMRIRSMIEERLGEQKIDLVVSATGTDAFFSLAVEKRIPLNE